MLIHDAHCHFFSPQFFKILAQARGDVPSDDPVAAITALLGWDNPGSPAELADHWAEELEQNEVGRAALIASVVGDEKSVAVAVQRHPKRFVGFFMVDPAAEEAVQRVNVAFGELGLSCVCLFPAMHGVHLDAKATTDIFECVAKHVGAAIFVHCGVLTVGVRKKLGLGGTFDTRFSNPLDLHPVATAYPQIPIIIPHFGAGFFREALILADLCPNIYFDTSSTNSWTKYHPGLTLKEVFQQALQVVGPDRLLFGTDSSFFPRGWQRAVWEKQATVLEHLAVETAWKENIFQKNFDRLFGG